MSAYRIKRHAITSCPTFALPQGCFSRCRMILPTIVVGVLVGTLLCSPGFAQPAAGPDQLKQAKKHLKQAEQEYDAALELCQQIIKSHPDLEPQTRLMMARIYLRKRKFYAALEQAQETISKYPKSEEALEGLDVIYEAHKLQGKADAAEPWLRRQVEVRLIPAGREAEALARLCKIYFKMGKFDTVLATAHKLIRKYPSSPEVQTAVYRVMRVYKARVGDEGAIIRLKEFVEGHPGTHLAACAQAELAQFYLGKKNRPQAITEYEKLLRAYPDSPLASAKIQRKIAGLYYYEGDVDRALVELDEALRLYPMEPDFRARTLYDVGLCYLKKREYDKAIEEYQKVLQLKDLEGHRYAYAETLIAYCYSNNDEYDRAIELYRQIVARYPSVGEFAPGAQYKIGYIYSVGGNYAQALEAFQKVLEDHPTSKWVPIANKRSASLKKLQGKHKQQHLFGGAGR